MTPTRRDVLTAFLGAAALGCAGDPAPSFDGRIVGPSLDVGHRLREAARAAPTAWETASVVVVGGGVAGLAAAWRLVRAGVEDVVLLELEEVPGGTSRALGEDAVVPYPWGAHYVPAPLADNQPLLTLLEEMGVVEGTDEDGDPIIAEEVLCRDPEERVFYKGTWYEGLYLHVGESDDDRAQLARFQTEIDRWVAFRDGRGRRAFAIPTALGSDDAVVTELDRMTMADWLDRHDFTSSRLRWLVGYACRDDYGSLPETTSAWAGLFYFASRQKRPGDESQSLMTWPDGNGRLVAHLYDRVRSRVRLGWLTTDVTPTDAGVDVVAVDRAGERVQGWHARHVVLAIPQYAAKHVVRPFRTNPPPHLASFEYGAWMVANLFLKDRPTGRGFPLAWDNVLYESPSLGYVVATHQRGRDHGPTVFTYYYPLCDDNVSAGRERLLSLGWSEWADVAVSDLRRAHPDLTRHLTRVDVMRWGHAMVRPRPGLIWGGACAAARRPVGGIHFAAADLSGVALFEEAMSHGVRAAEEVLAAREG